MTAKKVSQAELKRQIKALKDEIREKDTIISQAEIPAVPEAAASVYDLGGRWEMALGAPPPGSPIFFLDGDDEQHAGAISRIPQEGEDEYLFEIAVGAKTAYFGEIEDAALQGERWVDAVRGRRAVDSPVEIRKVTESEEQTVGQDTPREMRSTGDARDALDAVSFQVVDKPVSHDKMAELAFMEEELMVMVHDTTNEQDIPIPLFQNDGITQYFIRGKEQIVKRKFVEILARCKKTAYSQEAYKDATGADAYRQIPHTALMFPFAVTEDRNPRGASWLKGVLAEG